MANRTHLSIGEVLSLLQDEFPDVTISKIRFLESQGLLDPERTPSGYRKFYEPDVRRLRWILTQQRDHFLPLKVIKDRLDAGEDAVAAPAIMCHVFYEVPGGLVQRTRFWMGCRFTGPGRAQSCLPPGVAVPAAPVQGLARHNVREFTRLGDLLPRIYRELGPGLEC